ncbi:MAG TPA: D-aminoacyl-tRNA deacylase [Chitinophagales bacterium]|nr:D-aminoacyl-tRNA deacylase [Chitinophagales bacterium]HRG26668.1 D-aminoacyl-tRNA deacylase [Chitinophagales bacterium]HRG84845.1 D-aminoacyl-tRNA deacylase [Chitinophagales bacterium]HRH53257.1 D-aminoacyl-tRNA deacylase [Chitinophagales bacterium]
MRVVIQRVLNAGVVIEQQTHANIGKGLMILLGVEENDSIEDITWLTQKIAQLRIFEDANGLMNISVQDIDGEILVVSQFTLFASTKKGNRPSFIRSAKPDIAIPLYEQFVASLAQLINKPVVTGVFGADMQVQLINDGPVTIIIDSKAKE